MRVLIIMAVLAICACRLQAGSIGIADNGKSGYVILTPANPSASESLAAADLAKYIEQMSGAKLSIQGGGKPGAKSLVIAEVGHLGDWSKTPVSVSGEGYSMFADGEILYIIGGRGRSTLYAVYDLLDRLGCRFLAPDFGHYQGTNEVIPRTTCLALDLSSPIMEKPVLAIRKQYVEEGHSHNAENLIQMAEWMPKARFNTLVIPTNYQGGNKVKWDNWRAKVGPELQKRDIIIEVGGHGYQNFLNAEMEQGKLFDQHQEWFGVDDKGGRTRSHNRVFCTSNPDAVKYLAANLIAYLEDRPEIEIFDFWPPDGARWCECPKCKALGTPSNRQAILISQVKEQMAKAGVNTRLETIAYAAAVTPPESAKYIPDLLLDFCPIGQCFEVQINDPSDAKNADYVKQLTGLRKGFDGDISIYSYYRKYAWKSLPNLIPHYMQNDLKFYLTIPTQGISSYAEPGDWFAYELNHYALGNLAWNPSADVDALVSKFAAARYGSASKAAIHAYGVLEDVVRHYCCIPGTTLKTADEIAKAQAKLRAEVDSMKAAQSGVTDAGVRRNIDRFLLTIEYALRDMEVQRAKASKLPDAEIKAKIKSVADLLVEHANDGVFVMHSRVEFPRIMKTYGVAE